MTTPLMFRNHFQVAYVVRDVDKCVASLGEKFGVHKWEIRKTHPGAPASRLAFAYAGGVMLELVEPVPEAKTIFRDWIPEDPAAARFHHLGYFVHSEEEWRTVVDHYEAAGIKTLCGSVADLLDYGYADTVAQLGHWTEFVRLKPAGKDYFANVPDN